eukprot:5584848-Prymnesium_polylepis.2
MGAPFRSLHHADCATSAMPQAPRGAQNERDACDHHGKAVQHAVAKLLPIRRDNLRFLSHTTPESGAFFHDAMAAPTERVRIVAVDACFPVDVEHVLTPAAVHLEPGDRIVRERRAEWCQSTPFLAGFPLLKPAERIFGLMVIDANRIRDRSRLP